MGRCVALTAQSAPDCSSHGVWDGHHRKGTRLWQGFSESSALVDIYSLLVAQAPASSWLKTFSSAYSFNHLCSQEMFTEHLLCDAHYAMPWDYNGEEQVIVPVPRDTESNWGADK